MAFSVNALTSDGNALLAQATSSNPIVYIGAVASEYDFSAAEIADMGSIQDQGWTITDGVVVAASATDITARIIMGFYNRPQAVVCKTFGVVGRLQSQSDAQAVVVAAVSDPSASIRLPGSDEASVRVEVAIDMAISDQLSVSVTSSTAGSAMLSDLDRLVSCHKAGQPYSGDNQTIYGSKTFANSVNIISGQNLNFANGDIIWSVANDTAIRYVSNGTFNESLEIDADSAVIIGASKLQVNGNLSISGGVYGDFVSYNNSNSTGWYDLGCTRLYATNIIATNYTGGEVNGLMNFMSGINVNEETDFNGPINIDGMAPLDSSKLPFIPFSTGDNVGAIVLLIAYNTSGNTVSLNAGDEIPSHLTLNIAESYSQSSGTLTPTFGAGVNVTASSANYRCLHQVNITNNRQSLILAIRCQ